MRPVTQFVMPVVQRVRVYSTAHRTEEFFKTAASLQLLISTLGVPSYVSAWTNNHAAHV